MHPNWKALLTVDFPRKQFVRQSENPSDPASRRYASNGDNVSNGDDVRQFYESVLATETEHRTIKKEPDYFIPSPEPHKRKRSKLKQEKLKEDLNLDQNVIHQAFIAAQNDDLDNIRTIFSTVSSSAGLLAARDGYDWTLLMVASCANAGRVTQFLLELEGLDLGARDRGGNTALDLAQKRGHQNIVKLIKARQTEMTKPRRENKSSVTMRHGEQSTSQNVTGDDELTVNRNCEICQENFSTTQDWKKHVTSMIHQLNRSKQEVETGAVRTHFVIPEANRGFQMMLSGGWDKKGLGPSGSGKLYPVKTILKRDRHGLGLESDSGVKVTPKVTHFDPHDDSGVRDPTTRTERSSTLSRRQQLKKLSKEKAREVNFRREFCS